MLYYSVQYKQTTLNVPGGISASQTSGIILQNTDNVDATLPGIVCIDWASTLDTNVAEWITYKWINATTKELQGVTRGAENFSGKTHDNSAVVAFVTSASHISGLVDAFKNGFDRENYTVAYASGSTFTIAGVDKTAKYTAGRVVKFSDGSFGVVTTSSFSTNTTVTIEQGTVPNPCTTIDLSFDVYGLTAKMLPVRRYEIQKGNLVYAADAESTDTYVITLSPAPSAYTTGMVVNFKANTANTGAATINVNGLGAKSIVKNFNVALANNDIKAGQVVTLIYDGTNFEMQSQIGNSPSTLADSGWVSVSDSWTYASADDPTGVITVPSGAASIYSIGMRVKLTQTTVKYFIVTGVADTALTVYGGTDYTLANAAISAISYSSAKAPLGFPTDPIKWTVAVTDTTDAAQASPTDSTWYNPGISITIPIGCWRIYFKGIVDGNKSGGGTRYLNAALSTANNSASNVNLKTGNRTSPTIDDGTMQFYLEDTILLASKTVYYANLMSGASSLTSIYFSGSSIGATVIRAVCAYL